jgi:hypothetical protein
MAPESNQAIVFDVQSDDLDIGTLDLAVPAVAQARFLRDPYRYVREFLERHGQEVNEVSFAVSESGSTLAQCFAQLALAAAKPVFVHVKTAGPYKSTYVIK